MPYLLGYSVMGMLSFPLESEIAQEITAQTIFGAIEATGKLPVSI